MGSLGTPYIEMHRGFTTEVLIPVELRCLGFRGISTSIWEFPKIRGTLFEGPYNKDPTI